MEEISKVIVFQLADEHYAADIKQVSSIEKLEHVTTVPRTADFIKGVINLRGNITPIIDLKERLHIGKAEYTDNTRVVIITIEDIQVGLIVDSATDVVDIDPETIDDPPQMIGSVTEEYITGVVKRDDQLIILLDLDRVLNVDEINAVEDTITD
ncbi:chemotaxis protein CheW [Aquibacillus sediminis]|uniref:chemotaxis protein CheW n=1 Tax=Aquibacillus sediminis TaxID=2574734 RepID=UPI001107E3FA|nr:chemotaxis protein CheW [Aquibacillus sediminis]